MTGVSHPFVSHHGLYQLDDIDRIEVQAVNLIDLSVLYKGPLSLPSRLGRRDENPLLIAFSPNLRGLLIENRLFDAEALEHEPLSFSIQQTDIHCTYGRDWRCSFSACSTYIALVLNIWPTATDETGTAQIHIFHFNMRQMTYNRCNTEQLELSQYDRLFVDFHPNLPEIVVTGIARISSENKPPEADRYLFEELIVSTQLLNLENGTTLKLHEPELYIPRQISDPIAKGDNHLS